MAKFKFDDALLAVSIIGFIVILVSTVSTIDITLWADTLLFFILGLALFIQGGSKFFAYFENGLTPSEMNRMVTVFIGVASMATGVLIAPIFDFEFIILDGVKAFIAAIAVLVMLIEAFQRIRGN